MIPSEQEKCAELWEMISGNVTKPSDWCNSAGDALVQMVAGMRNCSRAMGFIPGPSGLKPDLYWLIKYAYQAIKHAFAGGSKGQYQVCINRGLHLWEDSISVALMMDC